MGRRLTRKQIKHDEFITFVDRAVHWLGGNWKQAGIGLGGALVVVLLWWGVTTVLSSRSGGAANEVTTAMAEYAAPVGSAAPADAKLKFATDTERLDTAEKHFKRIASRYWLTPQARVARLFLARIAADRGDLDGAIRLLSEITSKRKDDPVIRLAMLDLIRVRLAKGGATELTRDLEAMVAGKDPRLPRDVALFELALIWEREGKTDEATKLYRKLVEDFPDSPYRYEAQQKLSATS